MKFTHFVQPEFDSIGLAGEVREIDEHTAICVVKLYAIKGVALVAVVDRKSLKPMEVVK